MALLSYLGQLAPTGPTLYLNSVQPYQVAWDQVAIHVCHTLVPNSHILYALNASVVALAVIPTDKVTGPLKHIGHILQL